MSPVRQGTDLRDWDLGSVPTEVVASAFADQTPSIAGRRASASCAAAIVDHVAPPDSGDAHTVRDDLAASVLERIDMCVDVRHDDWWADVATLLVLGVPLTLSVGPVPRKRHGWPRDFRELMRTRAVRMTEGWGDAGQCVRESKVEPGAWPKVDVPATPFVSERTLDAPPRTKDAPRNSTRDDTFTFTWHMPGMAPTSEHVRVGRWRTYAIWQIGALVSAVRLPPVLTRCTLDSVTLSPTAWVTTWTPDRQVWPDV